MTTLARPEQDAEAACVVTLARRFGEITPCSNAQSEGQITKLKLLKRQMYGRASFDLLRRRVLLAA